MGSSWISLNARPVPLFVKHATLHHNVQPALEVTSLTKTSNANFVEMLVQNAVLITIVPNVKVHFTWMEVVVNHVLEVVANAIPFSTVLDVFPLHIY